MPPWNHKPPDMGNADISFDLQRLFDSYNFDHIPEEKRVGLFRQRNMAHVRHYKAAVKIFGGPISRKRFIIAPDMETPLRHRLGEYMDVKTVPEPPILGLEMKTRENPVIPTPKAVLVAQEEAEKLEAHQKWIEDRKKLRSDLNNMGINQGYLERKPNKTPLENLLMNKIIKENKPPAPKPIPKPEYHLEPDPGKAVPQVKLPSPKALRLIDEFLQEKKMRLIDLFTSVDKNKNWTLSRIEFRKAMKKNNVPLSDEMIEDLVLALDTNCSDELDFCELSKGMIQFKRERRYNKRIELAELFDRASSGLSEDTPLHANGTFKDGRVKSGEGKAQSCEEIAQHKGSDQRISSAKYSVSDPIQDQAEISRGKSNKSPSHKNMNKSTSPDIATSALQGSSSPKQYSAGENPQRITSAGKSNSDSKSRTSSRTSSSSQLTVPEFDLRPEQYIFGSDEAMMDHMKVTRSVLNGSAKGKKGAKVVRHPSVIRTGDKAIDDHSSLSQLDGDTGEMVNKFRQEKLRDYYSVRALCHERGLDLTKELLDKVLLHPADKTHDTIMRELRQESAKHREAANLAEMLKKEKEAKASKNAGRSKRVSRRRVTDIRQTFPKADRLATKGSKMNLSTGKAFIKPLTQCWMTFEEYDRFTSQMSRRYRQLNGQTNYNAFWPGYMLDKLRMYLAVNDPPGKAEKGSGAIFQNVRALPRSNPGYDNNLNIFPIDCNGWVKYGVVDQYLRKPIVL